ncbi:DUF4232 domain-containing protein [Amycolatopsis sp. CA-230715]|uniref:DUF4232 domain-containing protein n=1 Tax=Amycolatopsis sp. CA-230715 TaxID=2745196 RepID=UPI001C02D590|nr:DUF4232 domain-containing protein [Amycolatopsis sp. CA-230715]
MTKRTSTATLVLAAAIGVGGLLSACGGGNTGSAPQQAAAPTTESSTSAPATGSAPPSSSPAPSSQPKGQPDGGDAQDGPTAPGTCKAGELKVSLTSGDGAGAGSTFPNLQFTNTGSRTCTLQGSPGVSFVTGTNGAQVGKPATREPKGKGKVVTLAPGKSAASPLKIARTEMYGPECKPTDVRGLRVYAPGDTAAMFVEDAQQACSAANESQLSANVVR